MSISELVYAALSNDAGVSALVSTRVYPVILPQRPTLPAISYQRISNSVKDGTSDIRQSRWQVDGWAQTYAGITALSAAIKTAMDAYHDTDQSPMIKWTDIVNELDDYDPETDLYRVSLDLILITNGD